MKTTKGPEELIKKLKELNATEWLINKSINGIFCKKDVGEVIYDLATINNLIPETHKDNLPSIYKDIENIMLARLHTGTTRFEDILFSKEYSELPIRITIGDFSTRFKLNMTCDELLDSTCTFEITTIRVKKCLKIIVDDFDLGEKYHQAFCNHKNRPNQNRERRC